MQLLKKIVTMLFKANINKNRQLLAELEAKQKALATNKIV